MAEETNIIFDKISANLDILTGVFQFAGGEKIDINQYTGAMNTYCTAEDLNDLANFNNIANNNFSTIAKDTIEALYSISGTVNTNLSNYALKTDLNNYYTKSECDSNFWTITAGENYVDSQGFATRAYVQQYHSDNLLPQKFTGKSMFEVFYALTTEQINGAVPLDGQTYDLSDEIDYTNKNYPVVYSDFVKFAEELYIRSKKLTPTVITCSLDDYESELTTYGECAKFGVKEENGRYIKIRVPLIKSIIQPTTPDGATIDIADIDSNTTGIKGTLSEIIKSQLPNIKIEALAGGINNGYLGLTSTKTDDTVFYVTPGDNAMFGDAEGTADEKIYFNLNVGAQNLANTVYNDSCTTVQPQTVMMKLFMQVVPTGTQYVTASNLPIGTIFIYPNFNNLPKGSWRCDGSRIFSDGTIETYSRDSKGQKDSSFFSKNDYESFKKILAPDAVTSGYIFTSITDWEDEVATFNYTGKFALDTDLESGLEYIKLPRLSDCFIESTVNISESGTATDSAIPNLSGSFRVIEGHPTVMGIIDTTGVFSGTAKTSISAPDGRVRPCWKL